VAADPLVEDAPCSRDCRVAIDAITAYTDIRTRLNIQCVVYYFLVLLYNYRIFHHSRLLNIATSSLVRTHATQL